MQPSPTVPKTQKTPKTPLSTYRVQLRPEFGFAEAAAIAGYLAELGISHLYASPYLQAAQGSAHHLPVVSLVWIENTHMPAQGRPLAAAEVGAVVGAARAHGLPVHCDGARIWNAAIALGVPPAQLAAGCDTVMFCLSKGLGAPVGSVLCGSSAVIEQARAHRHTFGGAMRQAGIIAAAGIVALETMVERLADERMLPAIVFVFSRAGCDAAVEQCVASGLRLTTSEEARELQRIARRPCRPRARAPGRRRHPGGNPRPLDGPLRDP